MIVNLSDALPGACAAASAAGRSRRAGRGAAAFEFKCTDSTRTTKSMHIVFQDLGLEHLWVVYPGDVEYSLTDTITALPLKNIHRIHSSTEGAPH